MKGSPDVIASTECESSAAGMSGGGISTIFTSSIVMPAFFSSRKTMSRWFA